MIADLALHISELRDDWYCTLRHRFSAIYLMSPPKPSFRIVGNVSGRRGCINLATYNARLNRIDVGIATLLISGELRTVIGHEMVHCFQFYADPSSEHHGELFRFLMVVANLPPEAKAPPLPLNTDLRLLNKSIKQIGDVIYDEASTIQHP